MRKSTTVLAAALALVSVGMVAAQSSTENKLSLHLASLTPVDGFQARSFDGSDIYVAPGAAVTQTAVQSANSTADSDLSLSISGPSVRHLQSLLRKNGVAHMAIFTGGKLTGFVPFTLDARIAELTLSGLSAKQFDAVSEVVRATPTGAMIILEPSQRNVFPGREVTVDVYVEGVANLRTFQTSLEQLTGKRGTLELVSMDIDTARPDYVFAGVQAIGAPDTIGHRLGAVMMSGGVDATARSYLGTATYRASADAEGTFKISVRSGDRATLLWTADNEPVAFGVNAAIITVGRKTKTDR